MRLEEIRVRAVSAVRAIASTTARDRARRILAEIRRRPDVVVALAFAAGVVVMILHWR